MAGYLDAYGKADERRERITKRILLWGFAVLIVAGACYFTFRNWHQEQVVKDFLTHLRQKDYQGAYKLWDSTKYYGPEKFIEDWGPSSPYANADAIRIAHEDRCGEGGDGVVFDIETPNNPPIGLYVKSGADVVGFAPWPRCPGKHFQLWQFLKSRFG